MASSEELRAALAVAELEEELVAAKDGDGPSQELKAELREARRAYRSLREGREPGPDEARPAVIKAGAKVEG